MLLEENSTSKIIGAFYNVYNTLGYGFLEKVYERALVTELEENGFRAECQEPIKVHYNGKPVGNYFADIVVDEKVVLEIKAAAKISKAHETQLINYLKATQIEIGFVLNFGPEPAFRRKIYSNSRKRFNDALFDQR